MVKKIEKRSFGCCYLSLALLLLIAIFCFYTAEEEYDNSIDRFTPDFIPNSEEEIVNNCNSLDLLNTGKCLVANVRTFYKYKQTDDSITLSFNALKTIGGDCRNWALLYASLGEELGFRNYTYGFKNTDDSAHRFAVISNEEGYIILDQRGLAGGVMLGGSNETN